MTLIRLIVFMGLLIEGMSTGCVVLAAEIAVEVDRNPVALNESFQLTYTASNALDADPDFSPLSRDFAIHGQSQSSNVSVVNGKTSRTTAWTLEVMAKKAGQLTIPAIQFGSDRSRSLSIQVKDAADVTDGATNQDIFLEVEAEPRNPYVQAQVIYTMRLLHRVDITQASLNEPELEDAVIEKLGEDSRYRTHRNGRQYNVVERKYAIFPQKSGEVVLAPLTLDAQVATGRRSGFGLFSRQATQLKRLRSNPVVLNVRPVPSAFTGSQWLPAESLHLSEDWSQDPVALTAGEPVTRTIALLAKGVSVGQLPELRMQPPLGTGTGASTDTIKLYPDQPALTEEKEPDGIASIREEKTALIPGQSGSYTLAAIEVSWWNTQKDQMEVTRLPERSISVAAGSSANTSSPPAAPSLIAQPVVKPQSPTLPASDAQAAYWQWLTGVLGVGWLMTGLLWWRSSRTKRPSVSAKTDEAASIKRSTAFKAVKAACRSNQAQGSKDALLLWGQSVWPEAAPASLGSLAMRCEGELGAEIQRLSQALYGRKPDAWTGSALWTALQQYDRESRQRRPSLAGKNVLQPLYRL